MKDYRQLKFVVFRFGHRATNWKHLPDVKSEEFRN